MKIGSLYQTKDLYWLLYPSQDIAVAVAAAAYWSKQFNCNICYLVPSSIFMLLEQTDRFCKVFSTEGMVGWIYLALWCKDDIEEVKVE